MTATIDRPGSTPSESPRASVPRRSRRPAGRATRGFLVLLASVVVLNLIGLVMVLSASSVTGLYDYGSSWHFFVRQAMWVGSGLVVMLLVARTDYHRWRRWGLPLMAVSFALLCAVLAVGLEVNGAKRWLGTETISVQPSEFAKLALIVFVADLLARRTDQMYRADATLRPVIIALLVFCGLVMLQPNLGTTVLIGLIVFSMLFVGGAPLRWLGSVGFVALAGAALLAIVEPYRVARLRSAYDPWSDPLNGGYQSLQSMAAVSSGGTLGRGLGAGRAKWEYLPEAHTDFIYAILTEELGLVGAFLVLGLFATFMAFGVRTALRAPDAFGRLIATGVTAWIVFQTAVNIGAVLGLLPITGVPLPFVSFGGSAMIVTMGAAGLLLSVARQSE